MTFSCPNPKSPLKYLLKTQRQRLPDEASVNLDIDSLEILLTDGSVVLTSIPSRYIPSPSQSWNWFCTMLYFNPTLAEKHCVDFIPGFRATGGVVGHRYKGRDGTEVFMYLASSFHHCIRFDAVYRGVTLWSSFCAMRLCGRTQYSDSTGLCVCAHMHFHMSSLPYWKSAHYFKNVRTCICTCTHSFM